MKDTPLGPNQTRIIQWLQSAQDSEQCFTVSQIYKGTGIAKQTIERTILSLVQRGYVEESYAEGRAVYQAKELTR